MSIQPFPRYELDTWTPEEQETRRQLRLVISAFTALLWADNITEHYRGGFYHPSMWAPITIAPIAATTGVASTLTHKPNLKHAFTLLSAAQASIGLAGFYYHQRGIMKREGHGWRMYVFNAWYGPPAFAPLQYLGFGIVGLLAAAPRDTIAPLLRVLSLSRLLRLFVALNIPPLWAEIAYFHWRGSFQSPFQWVPVIALPVVGVVSGAATFSRNKPLVVLYKSLAWVMMLFGVVGTVFHWIGIGRQYRGYSRKAFVFNWLSGPPVLAPLQVIALGLIMLIGEQEAKDKV